MKSKIYQHIKTTEDLSNYCEQIAACKLIAMDTEFMRERTYYSELSLIQIGTDQGHAIIDPLAKDIDLSPLKIILTSPTTLKIFHAGDQDIELFYQELGIIPSPVFDTQIACQALGFGDSISYSNLVQSMLDITLDKSQQYTHWNKRPLTDEQLEYALADVTHLLEITPRILAELKEKNRMQWLEDAHEELIDPKRMEVDMDRIVRKMRHNIRKPIQFAALYKLTAWREKEAMRVNKPRGFILKDEVLVEIAKKMPTSTEQLATMRLLTPIKNTDRQALIIKLLDEVRNADPGGYPHPPSKPDILPNNELVGLLSLVLKQRCKDEDIAAKLIAGRKDLEQVAIGRTDIPCMQGWRYEIYGKYAEQLMQGGLHFHWDSAEQTVVMDELSQS